MHCPVCGDANVKLAMQAINRHGRHILGQEEFDVFFCEMCKSYFLNVDLTKEYYAKYYGKAYYEQDSHSTFFTSFSSLLNRVMLGLQRKMVERFLPKGISPLRWLDVGAGSGEFLASLPRSRFMPVACEINPEGCELIRKKNIALYKGDFLAQDFRDSFDVVSFWHVLEHVKNPLLYLQRCQSILHNDGVLMVALPNTDGLGFQLGKSWWYHMDVPRHVWLGNSKTFDFLAKKSGWKIVARRSLFWQYPLDLFWSLGKSQWKWLVYPFYPLVKVLSKETMLYILRKELHHE